jgi:hypothetical protein
MDKYILMKHDIAEFCKEFAKPSKFLCIPHSLKDQSVLNSASREAIIAVLCKNPA